MKKLSKVSFLFTAFIMLAQIFLPTLSYAIMYESNGKYTNESTVNLSMQLERPDVYKIGNQYVIGIKDESGTSSYYCLRGGLGFGNIEDESQVSSTSVQYSYIADLINKNEVRSNLTYLDENSYKAICWIADNMYVKTAENASELKSKLLSNANIINSVLTDDDIEVVEQIALWYFTNADKANELISSFVIPLDINDANNDPLGLTVLTINGEHYSNDETQDFNYTRAMQINKLYRYFVENAQIGNYILGENVQLPTLTLEKESVTPTIEKTTISGLNAYLVGPFKVIKNQGNIDYTASFTCKINEESVSRTFGTENIAPVALVRENGTDVITANDAIASNEFYVRILNNVLNIEEVDSFKLNLSYSYSYNKTVATVWTAGDETQPVLKVEKEIVEDSKTDIVEVTIPKKEFDLSLRKFITKINGTVLTGENDRTPRIYLEELRSKESTTASYVHPKNPIYLKRGDIIVYTIRIYNEGEIDGYATEVTDYLCDDLEFIAASESTINATYGWVQDSENPQIIRTNKLTGTKINAYDSNITEEEAARNNLVWQPAEDGTDGLYYADLQIECKIKDSANVNITLPNVAEITDDYNEDGEPDRDSEPESLKDDDIRDYENNPWYEDDDDYERVIIEPDIIFDLSLRKYITKVNNIDVTNTREPEIDFEGLDAGTSKTAYYAHRKDPVVVSPGDIVTYNITIYNEGEQVGRATKIVDQLPKGLRFIEIVLRKL